MIRKWLVLLMAFLLMAACACGEEVLRGYDAEAGYVYVTFGRYYQSIDGGIPDDGKQTWEWHQISMKELKEAKKSGVPFDPGELEKDPVLWRVLSVDGEDALLMSEYVLFASVLHPRLKEYEKIGTDFSQTELSEKLNGPFTEETFSAAEQEALIPYENLGKVFLADKDTLKNKEYGFVSNKARKAWATEYAIRITGQYQYQPKNGNHSPYWTRTQTVKAKKQAFSTKMDGSIGSLSVTGDDMGVRPMVLLDTQKVTITGGSGTKEDPYRLEAAETMTE